VERAQTALEPGNGAAGELFKGPMVGIRLFLSFFFQGGRVIASLFWPDPHAPVQGQGHEQQEAIQPIRGTQVRGFELKTATLKVREHRLNGLITNDKFCLIRTGRLALSWWRRPLRLRDSAPATYLHEVSVPRGGAYEAIMASAPTTAGEPGRGAAVGSGLPAPAALGDANRAGGDR
jgi:hypothetical protein